MLKEKYPVKVGSVIVASISQVRRPQVFGEAPFATLSCMRSFAEYCGISYASLRVTLTRWKKTGWIESFCDESGKTRYRMPGMMKLIADHAVGGEKSRGFTVAIFSFKKDDEKERQKMREILAGFGFKKLAQNAYLNVRLDSGILLGELAKFGLQDNLFLFDCEDVPVPMKDKIKKILELDKWNRRLEEFYQDLLDFLRFDGLSDEEIYNRFNYAASVFYTYFQVEHPVIPKDFFPEDYAYGKISELLDKKRMKYRKPMADHYLRLNQ